MSFQIKHDKGRNTVFVYVAALAGQRWTGRMLRREKGKAVAREGERGRMKRHRDFKRLCKEIWYIPEIHESITVTQSTDLQPGLAHLLE